MTRTYRPYGASYELFHCREPRVVIEGGAGTGKSLSVAHVVNVYCETFPGSRWVFVRQTRKSMTESVLVTWEDEVLGHGHPAITGTASRAHRMDYTYPNGSHVWLVGMDHPDRIMSSQVDGIVIFEATEVTQDAYEKLCTRMRAQAMPFRQCILDVNPGSEYHWINQLANEGKIHRLRSRHEDNPLLWDHEHGRWTEFGEEYWSTLSTLTGARLKRLRDHQWCSEEGQVWEEFDPAIHLVSGELYENPEGSWWIRWPESIDGERREDTRLTWFAASVDWGYSAPGVLQVWGVDADKNAYRVEEWYHTQRDNDWWAEIAAKCYEKYALRFIACDPSRPDQIRHFNSRIGPARHRDAPGIATEGNNRVQDGIEVVRAAFKERKLYLLRDALQGSDEERRRSRLPLCTEQEIPSYVWLKNEDGKPLKKNQKDRPNPECEDHGCDALRYFAMAAWNRDLSDPAKPKDFKPGSLGNWMGWGEDEWEAFGK